MDTVLFNAFVIVATGITAAIVTHLAFGFLQKKAGASESRIDDIVVISLGKPLTLLAFFIPLYFSIQYAVGEYPQYAWITDTKYLTSLYLVVATWIVATFVDGFLRTYGMVLARQTETDVDDRIIAILQVIAKYLIWLTGLLMVFSNLNINITPIIAGAGIIGIAIALAAQDVFSNFFGSAVIVVDQPFRAGDRIMVNDVLGDVIHIGPRSTRIITLDSDIVTIPNTKIATSVVHNYSLPNPQVRVQVQVSVSCATDSNLVKTVLHEITDEAVRERSDVVAPRPEPTVFLTKIDRSAMTFQVTVYARGFQFNSLIQDYLNSRIIERFRKDGIIIA